MFYIFFRELSVSSFIGQFVSINYSESGVSGLFEGDDIREGLNGISYIAYVTTTRFFEVCVSANARAIICV